MGAADYDGRGEPFIERLERLVEEAADAVNRSDIARAEQSWRQAFLAAPWYPSARLYRQPKAGDWLSVIERIERDRAERTFTAFGAAA